MREWWEKVKKRPLFVQIFVVMVISITAVSLLTTFVTVQMSMRLFVNTFSITNARIMNQIMDSFEQFNSAILTASYNAWQSGAVRTFLTEKETTSAAAAKSYFLMGQEMNRMRSKVDAYDVEIMILGMNGRSSYVGRRHWLLSEDEVRNSRITANTIAEPKRLMYHYDAGSAEGPAVIVASKALTDRYNGNVYGVFYAVIRESDFRQFYSSFTTRGNDVAVLDASGRIISSNQTEWIGEQNPDMLHLAEEITRNNVSALEAFVKGKDRIVLAEYVPFYDMYLVNIIDKELALSQMFRLGPILLISVIIVAAALVIVYYITRKLTKSLTLLVQQMSNITTNKFANYVDIDGNYETRELGQAFNYMLDELNDYVEQLIQTQKEQRNAELAALQMQINPHFLYNTLASIKTLVQQGNKEKASDTINALISLLQNTIGNVSETVTVEQELENTRNYAYINHVRYGNRIRVHYFAAPDCLSCRVPKLILQPFIENAFFHAFQRKQEGNIYVLISKEGDSLICEVADNGDGMQLDAGEETLPNSKRSRHLFPGIGIRNVNDRIALLYGKEYGVTITSQLGEGTRVRIKLPIIE